MVSIFCHTSYVISHSKQNNVSPSDNNAPLIEEASSENYGLSHNDGNNNLFNPTHTSSSTIIDKKIYNRTCKDFMHMYRRNMSSTFYKSFEVDLDFPSENVKLCKKVGLPHTPPSDDPLGAGAGIWFIGKLSLMLLSPITTIIGGFFNTVFDWFTRNVHSNLGNTIKKLNNKSNPPIAEDITTINTTIKNYSPSSTSSKYLRLCIMKADKDADKGIENAQIALQKNKDNFVAEIRRENIIKKEGELDSDTIEKLVKMGDKFLKLDGISQDIISNNSLILENQYQEHLKNIEIKKIETQRALIIEYMTDRKNIGKKMQNIICDQLN